MTNEAVLIYETSKPIPMTCADGTGIEKGALLKMADPMTVSASAALADIFGGIAAEEKIASDGKTKIPVYRRGGIFKVVASGSITVGDPIVLTGLNNLVQTAATNAETVLGIALETCTDGETLAIELNPTTMQLA